MTQTIDLSHIKAVAEAATPGPWEWAPANFGTKELISLAQIEVDGVMVDPDPDELEFLTFTSFTGGCESPTPADQAFIAVANPAVVLALVARIEALEAGTGS